MPPGGLPPGPPFSEGTGAICRVPSLGFLPSPERIARLFPCVGLGYGAGNLSPRPWAQTQRSRFSVFPGDPLVPLGFSQVQPQGREHPVQKSCFPWVERLRALLRDRFTLRRFTERRNPGTFGDPGLHRILRYSCQHSHFRHLQWTSRSTFIGPRNVPLPTGLFPNQCRRFGARIEPRYILGGHSLDQCALTRSSKDGCFQAHLLAVFGPWPSFPTHVRLRDLSVRSGLFPS